MQDDFNITIFEGIALQLQEKNNNLILTRSKSGNRIDTLAILLGSLSIPILGFAIGLLLARVNNHNLHIGTIFPIAILFYIGIYLFTFFLKGWNRKLMFGGFSLEKNPYGYKVTQMVHFKTAEQTYPIDSTISLNTFNNDISVSINENGNEHELFKLIELNSDQVERVENIVAKFNS